MERLFVELSKLDRLFQLFSVTMRLSFSCLDQTLIGESNQKFTFFRKDEKAFELIIEAYPSVLEIKSSKRQCTPSHKHM